MDLTNFGATKNHSAIVILPKTLKISFDCSVMYTCISVIEILADIMANLKNTLTNNFILSNTNGSLCKKNLGFEKRKYFGTLE